MRTAVMIPIFLCSVFAMLILAEDAPKLPGTPVGKRVAAYFAAFNAGEQAMRGFIADNFAPDALKSRPMDERLGIYRHLKTDLGGLDLR
jgi:hypothetical protein